MTMPRLIKALDIIEAIQRRATTDDPAKKCAYRDVLWDIAHTPTIDAEPVVRCKDCKHRQDPQVCYMCFTEVVDVEGGRMYKFTDLTQPDGFCHKGAKEDDHDQTD